MSNDITDGLHQYTVTLNSETDTQAFAQQLAKADISGSVWLSGDLGAGKTTLTRYWLKELGHQGSVKSPTYTLVEPYGIQQANSATVKPVYHADLYRLQDPEELEFIGFDEYLDDATALIIIEWASRAEGYLPEPIMRIDIRRHEPTRESHVNYDNSNNEVRQVTISYNPNSLNLMLD